MYKVFKCGTIMETVTTISLFILLKKSNFICIPIIHQKLSQCSLFSMLETVLVKILLLINHAITVWFFSTIMQCHIEIK